MLKHAKHVFEYKTKQISVKKQKTYKIITNMNSKRQNWVPPSGSRPSFGWLPALKIGLKHTLFISFFNIFWSLSWFFNLKILHMGNKWHLYVMEQVVKSVSQIKQCDYIFQV